MIRLAIYDMDKTITRRPTWTPFLRHAARGRARWRMALAPVAGAGAIAYAARLTGRAGLKGWTQRMMLGPRVPRERIVAVAEAFAARTVATDVLEAARQRIAADRAEGYRVVLATASFRYYAEAIALALGIGDVIATESPWDGAGRLRPGVDGENCYGPAKLRMIEAWLARNAIRRDDAFVRFYSDHVSDAPALEWADEAFAVNPHPPLRRMAQARGWTILEWREKR